jgi:type VI secretion system protein VasI
VKIEQSSSVSAKHCHHQHLDRWVPCVVAVWLASGSGAFAASDKEIARCATIDDGVKRLQCYDALAQTNHLDQPETKFGKGTGQWRVWSEVSKVDDSTNVYVSTDAEAPIKGWLKSYLPTITIRCVQGKTQAYIVTGMAGHMDHLNYTTSVTMATFRVDRQKAFFEELSASTDREVLFLPHARNLLESFLGTKRCYCRLYRLTLRAL